ncbi:MAG: hypothetical protein ACLPKB_12530 [Xanthobacteraceae bacterium]
MPPVDPATMVAARVDIARLEEECATLQNRAGDLDIRCRAATDDARKAAEDVARLAARMVGFTAIAEQVLDPWHDTAPREANLGSARLARLTERDPAGTAEQAGAFPEAPDFLAPESENTARRDLKNGAAAGSNSSRKLIDAIADPLRVRVQPSRKKVETRRSHRKAAKPSRSKSRGK